jgi:hypothetical protein
MHIVEIHAQTLINKIVFINILVQYNNTTKPVKKIIDLCTIYIRMPYHTKTYFPDHTRSIQLLIQ